MKSLAFGLGLAIFFLGITTEVGYALGWSHLYSWDHSIGMAVNTGIGFTLTGLALCILASHACRNCSRYTL